MCILVTTNAFTDDILYNRSISLTVIRPAGIEYMMRIRSEADVQHAPTHITSLHCTQQVKPSSAGVIQSNVLVYSKCQRIKIK